MKKLKMGIICPSDIATRRFLPAVTTIDNIEFCGVAVNSVEERYGSNKPSTAEIKSMLIAEKQKSEAMIKNYGGELFDSYTSIVNSPDIDALYIPLPPALHYKWAKMALESGKHVFVEKPATTLLQNTSDLIGIAMKSGLSLHENYMFVFHKQLEAINNIVASGELGEVRLYRISFGFPLRALSDFRYNHSLGGGALLDAGGYTIKYASYLLGETAKVVYAQMNHKDSFEVDIFGSGALSNDQGLTAQISFGMDNDYKCELEVWGSKGTLTAMRVLTAPAGFNPSAIISRNGKKEIVELPADDAFQKSIFHFIECVNNDTARLENYKTIERQAGLVEDFVNLAIG